LDNVSVIYSHLETVPDWNIYTKNEKPDLITIDLGTDIGTINFQGILENLPKICHDNTITVLKIRDVYSNKPEDLYVFDWIAHHKRVNFLKPEGSKCTNTEIYAIVQHHNNEMTFIDWHAIQCKVGYGYIINTYKAMDGGYYAPKLTPDVKTTLSNRHRPLNNLQAAPVPLKRTPNYVKMINFDGTSTNYEISLKGVYVGAKVFQNTLRIKKHVHHKEHPPAKGAYVQHESQGSSYSFRHYHEAEAYMELLESSGYIADEDFFWYNKPSYRPYPVNFTILTETLLPGIECTTTWVDGVQYHIYSSTRRLATQHLAQAPNIEAYIIWPRDE